MRTLTLYFGINHDSSAQQSWTFQFGDYFLRNHGNYISKYEKYQKNSLVSLYSDQETLHCFLSFCNHHHRDPSSPLLCRLPQFCHCTDRRAETRTGCLTPTIAWNKSLLKPKRYHDYCESPSLYSQDPYFCPNADTKETKHFDFQENNIINRKNSTGHSLSRQY